MGARDREGLIEQMDCVPTQTAHMTALMHAHSQARTYAAEQARTMVHMNMSADACHVSSLQTLMHARPCADASAHTRKSACTCIWPDAHACVTSPPAFSLSFNRAGACKVVAREDACVGDGVRGPC
eukprot:2290102-Pleurochrysis_carterae.AAC.1